MRLLHNATITKSEIPKDFFKSMKFGGSRGGGVMEAIFDLLGPTRRRARAPRQIDKNVPPYASVCLSVPERGYLITRKDTQKDR